MIVLTLTLAVLCFVKIAVLWWVDSVMSHYQKKTRFKLQEGFLFVNSSTCLLVVLGARFSDPGMILPAISQNAAELISPGTIIDCPFRSFPGEPITSGSHIRTIIDYATGSACCLKLGAQIARAKSILFTLPSLKTGTQKQNNSRWWKQANTSDLCQEYAIDFFQKKHFKL